MTDVKEGFLRAKQIHKHPENPTPLIPVGATTWWLGVKRGIYPQPIKISTRVTVWRAEDIRKFIEETKSLDEI